MRVDELLRELLPSNGVGAPRLPRFSVKQIVTNPLTVSKNSIFVCTRTAIRDGHYSALDAYARGCRVFVAHRGLALPSDATVLVVEDTEAALAKLSAQFYGIALENMRIFGITGTHGKSAVALMTAEILRRAGRRVAVLTGDGAHDGRAFSPAGEIVPDAADVWRFLHRCAANGVEIAILECSAYMLRHGTAAEIPFEAALMTDLAPHHIGPGMHRNFDAYRSAKELLFRPPAKLAYIPTSLSAIFSEIPVTPYGKEGVLEVTDEGAAMQGTVYGRGLTLRYQGETYNIFHPAVGDHAARNAEAAATLAGAAGLSAGQIAAALGAVSPTGRLELVEEWENKRIYLDVAYTGEELERALRALRPMTRGRLTVLLGSVGRRAKERRAALGAAAGRLAELTFFTSDDPDGEDPASILRDLTAEWPRLARYEYIPQRAIAIQRAVGELHSGDTLLILGKAQNDSQMTTEGKCYFSDREIARAALYLPFDSRMLWDDF